MALDLLVEGKDIVPVPVEGLVGTRCAVGTFGRGVNHRGLELLLLAVAVVAANGAAERQSGDDDVIQIETGIDPVLLSHIDEVSLVDPTVGAGHQIDVIVVFIFLIYRLVGAERDH